MTSTQWEKSRADVEAGNEEEEKEEEEESLKTEIPTVEMNPENPVSRAEREREDCGRAVYRNLCVKLVVLGDNLKLNRWRKKKENEQPQW